MKFKNFKKQNNKIVFNVKNVDVSILNSIRRVILSDIFNVAFEYKPYEFENRKVNIIENTCSLHNEIILQRLSMIPLKFDEDEIYNFKEEDYKFILKKKNNTNKMLNVTTEDIEIFDKNNKKYNEKFIRKIFPKNKLSGDFILITKLKPNIFDKDKGDVIDIEMVPSKSTASDYAGFGYVSQCVYYNVVDETLAKEALDKKIAESKNLSKKDIEGLKNDFNTLDKYRYFKKNEYDEPNYFEYTIESESRVSPEFLFFKANTIIKERLEKLIANIIDNKVKIDMIENYKNYYNFEFIDEGHTLGNLIQSMFYNYYIREDEKKIIEFVGYNCPHPLDNILHIKIKFNESIAENEVNKLFIDGIVKIQKDLDDMNKKWIEFSSINKKLIEVAEYL